MGLAKSGRYVEEMAKSNAMNFRLFTKQCGVEEASYSTYETSIFFTAIRWLSRGKEVQRMFELRAVIAELHTSL